MTNAKKTIHFVSLGCPKNRVDTEVMAGIAVEKGLAITEVPENAEVIVVNTCAFIESAKQESVDKLLEMARFRTDGNCRQLVAAGCLAQRYSEALADDIPELTHLLGTAQPAHLEQVLTNQAQRVDVGSPAHFLQSAETPRFVEPEGITAFIKIGDGCSRKCAFCAIPAIRGSARSRPLEQVVTEARRLIDQGIKELNLVAQDTANYGVDLEDGTDLTRLLHALNDLEGEFWIRVLYLYPDAIPDTLLVAFATLPKVVPYLDIPIQHASDRMLRAMRRGHRSGDLRDLIRRIREHAPDAFLRTSVLVGFPGETEADMDELLAFIEWAEFNHLGAFRYSHEEGTPAFSADHLVTKRDAYNRFRKVMARQRRISRRRNQALKHRELRVLIEGPDDDQGFVLKGRHWGQAPQIDGETFIVSCEAPRGSIITAQVIKTGDFDVVCEPI